MLCERHNIILDKISEKMKANSSLKNFLIFKNSSVLPQNSLPSDIFDIDQEYFEKLINSTSTINYN